eukprot:CAMPEP_0178967624 /NCGR_PEP_ID=MMETSP0789-20121207/17717_1 /TAXON_ID=3005 /ORGANISM="Rhizosolenia setigera, Strain CCMP 1694" /LENGTH=520 /DNA_ID=CAMNT_0020653293 /DNA_START=212 /DNA_END=1773 /DNA_ORIENTATION=+
MNHEEGEDDNNNSITKNNHLLKCKLVDTYGIQASQETERSTDDTLSIYSRFIRLQTQIDPDVEELKSAQDILEKIKLVTEKQNKYGDASLFSRTWVPKSKKKNTGSSNDEIMDKENNAFLNDEIMDENNALTIMQFNTLAEGLSVGPGIKTPFDSPRSKASSSTSSSSSSPNKNSKIGFTSVKHPEECLLFQKRKWRLLDVILNSLPDENQDITASSSSSLDALGPDIIAMEEVDRFHGFFEPTLEKFGYRGLFVPKFVSPCINLGWYSDGNALFFKRDAFKLISLRQDSYSGFNQVYMIATLLHKKTGKQIVVAVTHLKASSSIALDDVRRSQALELLQVVEEEVSKVIKYHSHGVDDHTTTTTTNSVMPSQHNGVSAASANTNNNKNNNNIPVFLLGDFNADPDDPCTTEDGIPLSSSPSKDSSLPCCLADLPSDSFLSWKSSYDLEDKEGNNNSIYTTWKRRGDYVAKRVIDYILYGEGVKCTHTLSIPSEDEIGENLLPSLRHPSDHISIAAKFLI